MRDVGGARSVLVADALDRGALVATADGKELRGAKNGGGRQTRLLAACDHATGAVIGHVEVGATTNEIPMVEDLLDQIGDVSGMVFTLDALHTQDKTAELITSRGADYVLSVKANQPGLLASCLAHPWGRTNNYATIVKDHGGIARWEAECQAPGRWVHFPGVTQVARITRCRKTAKTQTVETCHILTSVGPDRAGPAQIAAWVNGNWGIENRVHWAQDVIYVSGCRHNGW